MDRKKYYKLRIKGFKYPNWFEEKHKKMLEQREFWELIAYINQNG